MKFQNYYCHLIIIKHTLVYINLTFSDFSGEYACTTTVNSTPYVIWQTITIHPYPDIQVSHDKVVKCEDSVITLQCCVQGKYKVKWTDPVACNSTSTGHKHSVLFYFLICDVHNHEY